jgi:hypothetical protein
MLRRRSITIGVTGMHRSGTSIAARALDALGVSFGDPALLMDAGPDNEAGYWENRPIKELDDDLLAHLGGSWDSPPVLAPGWEHDAALEEFRVRATEIIDTSFGPGPSRATPIGWKDPRLSLLLPFWRTVCPIEGTVVIVRNPSEVAASLAQRNDLDTTSAHVLWLRYLLAAMTNDAEGHLLLDHNSLFEDPAGTLRAMASHFALPAPDHEVIQTVADHLDPALRHQHSPATAPAQTLAENPVVALAQSVWNGGTVTVDALDESVRRAVEQGWLRPPVDTEAFDQARARNVDLTELLRRRTRQRVDDEVRQRDEPDGPV